MIKGVNENHYYIQRISKALNNEPYIKEVNVKLNISIHLRYGRAKYINTNPFYVTAIDDNSGAGYTQILLRTLRMVLNNNGRLEMFEPKEHYLDILDKGVYQWYLEKITEAHKKARNTLLQEFDDSVYKHIPKDFQK